MARHLAIEYIGPSDEDRAHLRLLMRTLAGSLSASWQWGEEHRADVLFIDPSTLAGQMARTRAQEGGVRCIVLDDLAGASPGELVLQRPFRADVLRMALEMIAAAGDSAPPATNAVRLPLELESEPDLDPGRLEPPVRRPEHGPGPSHDDAEALFRRGVPARHAAGSEPAHSQRCAPATNAAAPTPHPVVRAVDPGSPLRDARLVNDEDTKRSAGRRLRDWLQEGALGGPSRIVATGLPALVLDPKAQVFHCAAPLAGLLPWLKAPIEGSAWQALTSLQLRQLRETEPAREYRQLQWLDALHRAGGHLPRHLDPGGSFRLSAPFVVAQDFPAQQRIVRALAHPIRLHELAAAAGVPMAQVFDAVVALDAVGLIECRPRERLLRPTPTATAGGASGLLARALASITVPRGGT